MNGAWQELEPVAIEDALPLRASVLRAAEEMRSENLVGHLREEESVALTGKFVGSHDAIARWSALAEAEVSEATGQAGGRIEVQEEALAYFVPAATAPPGSPDTLAWHDHTTAIIRIPENARHLTIDYIPSAADQSRVERYKARVTDEHKLETILDARGYYGRQTAVMDFWSSMRQQGWGFRTSIAGMGGFVVARVLRRLTREQPTLKQDPTFDYRLRRMSERFPDIAFLCSDLAQVQGIRSHDDAIVFVHGTVSSCFQGLKDLTPTGAFPRPLYRFEHDTFRPVEENAGQLVDLIRKCLQARRLTLVAHSRGGLVARIALAQLRRDHYPGETFLETFGTPHEGTPLADVGGQFLNLSYKLGCEIIGSVPALYPAIAAYSYVINCPVLPEGIDIMRQESRALGVMNALSDPAHIRCWGSSFNIANGPSGFGTFVTGALIGAMSGIDHDLVVPTASALACGETEPLLACSHVQYFAQTAVQQAIAGVAPAPPVGVFAAAADTQQPQGGPASGDAMALDHDVEVPRRTKLRPYAGPRPGPRAPSGPERIPEP